MSIINDALKKAEVSKDYKPVFNQEKYRQTIEHSMQKKSKQINWGPVFVLMVLFLITGPLIAPVFSTSFKRSNYASPLSMPTGSSYAVPIETAGIPVSSDNRKAQFGLEEMPLGQAAAIKSFMPLNIPTFNLSGIVFSAEGSYCIINNKVVRVGEEIGTAKLTTVNPNEVTLLYQGETMTLTVPE
jgi:hypothetical protein